MNYEILNIFLGNEIIQRLGWGLLHSIWEIAALALLYGFVVLLILPIFQINTAKIRYIFGYSVLLAMLVLPIFTMFVVEPITRISKKPNSSVSNLQNLESQAVSRPDEPKTGEQIVPPNVKNSESLKTSEISTNFNVPKDAELEFKQKIAQIIANFRESIKSKSHASKSDETKVVENELVKSEFDNLAQNPEKIIFPQNAENKSFAAFSVLTSWVQTYFLNFLQILSLTWCVGVLIMLFRLGSGFRELGQLRKKSVPVVLEKWQIALKTVAERLGIRLKLRKRIEVRASNRTDSPILLGMFKPLILVPVSMISSLSHDEIEVILIHELAHIKRYDYLANLVQLVIETLLFYHPLVFRISRAVRRDREYLCDEFVVTRGSIQPYIYAKTLMYLEEFRQQKGTRDMKKIESVPAASGASLKNRIRRLLNQPIQQERQAHATAAVLVLAVLLMLPVYAIFSATITPEAPTIQVVTSAPVDTFTPEKAPVSVTSVPQDALDEPVMTFTAKQPEQIRTSRPVTEVNNISEKTYVKIFSVKALSLFLSREEVCELIAPKGAESVGIRVFPCKNNEGTILVIGDPEYLEGVGALLKQLEDACNEFLNSKNENVHIQDTQMLQNFNVTPYVKGENGTFTEVAPAIPAQGIPAPEFQAPVISALQIPPQIVTAHEASTRYPEDIPENVRQVGKLLEQTIALETGLLRTDMNNFQEEVKKGAFSPQLSNQIAERSEKIKLLTNNLQDILWSSKVTYNVADFVSTANNEFSAERYDALVDLLPKSECQEFEYYSNNKSLVIKAYEPTHEQIRNILNKIRRLQPGFEEQEEEVPATSGEIVPECPTGDTKKYFLESPDIIDISVIDNDTGKAIISGNHLITPDGYVMLEKDKRVYVQGLTVDECKEAIKLKFSQEIKNISVGVDVFAFNSKEFFIITKEKTGDAVWSYPYTGKETLKSAINELKKIRGHDLTKSKCWIMRPVGNSDTPLRLEVDINDNSTEYQIIPNDRVFVSLEK
ncbi:MAG: M56 family metallopeptidase [Thermoguttaceae bacterium]